MMLPLCTSVTLLRLLAIAYSMRRAEQALGAFLRHRLDADAGGVREADLRVLLRERLLEELEELLVVRRAGLELDAGVDVFGVLAEDHHVDLLRRLDRRRHALEPAHRAQADVEVEHLAQRDVQRADAAADRRGQRALDRHQVLAAGRDGFVRQPGVEQVVGLLAGVDLHPVDLALAAVGLLHGGVEHAHRGAPDVRAGAVAFDERDDRLIGHGELAVLDRDFLPLRGHVELERCRHRRTPCRALEMLGILGGGMLAQAGAGSEAVRRLAAVAVLEYRSTQRSVRLECAFLHSTANRQPPAASSPTRISQPSRSPRRPCFPGGWPSDSARRSAAPDTGPCRDRRDAS